MKYLSIFIRVALLALGQSLDCHSASEVSLMDMGKSVNVKPQQSTAKQKPRAYFLGYTVCTMGLITQCSRSKWHIYASVNYAISGSDKGLSPVRCHAITWTNCGLFLNGQLRTNFSEIWIKIQQLSNKKIHLKTWPAKWRDESQR